MKRSELKALIKEEILLQEGPRQGIKELGDLAGILNDFQYQSDWDALAKDLDPKLDKIIQKAAATLNKILMNY